MVGLGELKTSRGNTCHTSFWLNDFGEDGFSACFLFAHCRGRGELNIIIDLRTQQVKDLMSQKGHEKNHTQYLAQKDW